MGRNSIVALAFYDEYGKGEHLGLSSADVILWLPAYRCTGTSPAMGDFISLALKLAAEVSANAKNVEVTVVYWS